jgi:hypothetical protein
MWSVNPLSRPGGGDGKSGDRVRGLMMMVSGFDFVTRI